MTRVRRSAGAPITLSLSLAAASLGGALVPRAAHAWLLHEHTRITATGVAALDEADKATLRAAWTLARTDALKLCAEPIQAQALGTEARGAASAWCVGFNALPALAADHSCHPRDLAKSIATGDWVSSVLHEARRLEGALAKSGGSVLRRIDERRIHDITLQLLDREYLTRASAGGAHFQLTRNDNGERRPEVQDGDDVLGQYLERALATGQESNATALYVNYHGAAIELAAQVRERCKAAGRLCEEARPFVIDALLSEAFALHFLEDAFSAGHFAGAWGDTAQRFGTHDYYCRHGIEAETFAGALYTANGDLFLKDVDARLAGIAVKRSLSQVLRAMAPSQGEDAVNALTLAELKRALPVSGFNACIEERIPPGLSSLAGAAFIRDVIETWPRPSLRTPEMPRFRAEVGPFFGASLSGEIALSGERSGAVIPEVRLRPALRVGYGLEGAMSRYMDGRFFAEVVGAGTYSALDGEPRFGAGARLHIPFAVIPGDGIFAPFAALGWGWAVWIAQQAALGSVYGFGRPFLLGEENTLQITLGRDATFLVYPETKALRERRFELLLSVLNMSVGRAYSQQVASEFGIELGFQFILTKGDLVNRTFGGYLSVSTGSRVYP